MAFSSLCPKTRQRWWEFQVIVPEMTTVIWIVSGEKAISSPVRVTERYPDILADYSISECRWPLHQMWKCWAAC